MKLGLTMFCLGGLLNLSRGAYTKLFWSEEFNDNTLNTNEWERIIGYLHYNGELQTYTDRNDYIKDGNLNIVAKQEYENNSRYTSTRITSKTGFKYGRIEARVKLPKGNGLWPAFWLIPNNSPYGQWPSSGEIDIMETSDNMNFMDATIHFGNDKVHGMTGGRTEMYGDFSTDFHTYAIEWEEKEIRWYIDSTLFCTKTSDTWWNNFGGTAPFDTDFHIVINLAVGGAYPNYQVDDSSFPHTLQVDYVRVYKDDSTPGVVPHVNVPAPPAGTTLAPVKPLQGAEVCYEGACPTGLNDCKINDVGRIFCSSCPAYASSWLRCGGTSDRDHQCDWNGFCLNGSLCSVTDANQIYCMQCPKGFSGDRCEIVPAKRRNLRGSRK